MIRTHFKLMHRIIVFVCLLQSASNSHGTHLKGTFNTNEFFHFLTRFGIQSTDQHDIYDTKGYIYGNITLQYTFNMNNTRDLLPNQMIMLTVMDYTYFIDYYNRRRLIPKHLACANMFNKIEQTAYLFDCNENGRQDFVRRVPCPNGRLCIDEDNRANVLDNHQFTYKIQDSNQARFWYLSFVACTREKCDWRDVYSVFNRSSDSATMPRPSYTIAYDIWIVNGHPNAQHTNRFKHHFSFELHNIFEIYLCSLLIYATLLPFIFYRVYTNFHHMYLQLFVYVCIELASRFFCLVHTLAFAYNGRGVVLFQMIGDFLEALSSSVLILILLSIAKGWTVRSKCFQMTKKCAMFGIFLQVTLVLSHMIAIATVDPIFNKNPYETVAGYVELSVRIVAMIWFVIELKETFAHLENAAARNTNSTSTSLKDQCNENESDSDEAEYEIVNSGKRYARLDSDLDEPNRSSNNNYNNNNNNNRTRIKKSDSALNSYYANITKEERLRKYQKFYLHYGACCLVWFIFLPMLILVTSFVSELYRLRLVLGIRYFVNFISVLILIYIMWSPKMPLKLPGKRVQYKQELFSLHYGFGGDDANDQKYEEEEEDDDEEEKEKEGAQLFAENS